MKYRVYKHIHGFFDIDAENEEDAYDMSMETSLNELEVTEEETAIIERHGQKGD